jgi:hypothetical protein
MNTLNGAQADRQYGGCTEFPFLPSDIGAGFLNGCGGIGDLPEPVRKLK